ncbi:hypothetical protein E3Q18_01041 [Wallemia mellicola]|nr:hypothetical protein E3Q18_01041 [Wallemia mellicola]
MARQLHDIINAAKFDERLFWATFAHPPQQLNSLNSHPHPISSPIEDENDRYYFFTIDQDLVCKVDLLSDSNLTKTRRSLFFRRFWSLKLRASL